MKDLVQFAHVALLRVPSQAVLVRLQTGGVQAPEAADGSEPKAQQKKKKRKTAKDRKQASDASLSREAGGDDGRDAAGSWPQCAGELAAPGAVQGAAAALSFAQKIDVALQANESLFQHVQQMLQQA
jgi:hypothetical protein